MADARTRRVFVEMFREEWRLHNRRFSGRRFAVFPFLVAVLVAGTVALLLATGTPARTIFAGIHALVFLFGLHTGSVGFIGRDFIRDLLGDLTLLVFSARTLPLSRRRLLGVFVLKDVIYYGVLFLLPLTVGVVPAMLAAGGSGAVASLPASFALYWVTLTGTFVLGIATTIAGVGLASRGVAGLAVLVAGLAAAVGAWVASPAVVALTPYGIFAAPSLGRVFGAAVLIAAVLLVGALTFDVRARGDPRAVRPAFRRWLRRVGDPVATRTLLDLRRSSGGFAKVVFSAAVLFVVTVALVDFAGRLTGVTPSVGISFGAILGLTAFTTYNWLTQFDDVEAYLVQPVDVAAVFRAKFRAFLLLGPPIGLAFYLVALAWRGGPPGEAAVGTVVLVGVTCYIVGVTASLAGLSPNEFLFDTALFATFGLAMAVPLVPILVIGFALAPVSASMLVGVGTVGVGLGVLGLLLFRLAIPKWSRRHRA